MKKRTISVLLFFSVLFVFACGNDQNQKQQIKGQSTSQDVTKKQTEQRPLITFVELGSVNCIPCRKMQPVMKAIEEKYSGQVQVIFYDIWKDDQKKYAQEYAIRLIPTQVFLDKDGKEVMRHEGFFQEEEIDAFLKEQGVTPKSES